MFACYEDFVNFFAKRLAVLREQKNVSAREMSLALTKSSSYINHIENKGNMPSIEYFYYICEYLGVSPKEFFDDGTKAPELLSELIAECKSLDKKTLDGLLTFIRNMK